jgi:hypothetical protein
MADLDKELWIAAARKDFVPSPRAPCVVCGKFKGITQAHHVVPLARQCDLLFEKPDHEHVWLCPNHHAIVHLFLIRRQGSPDKPNDTLIGASGDLDDDHYQIIMSLLGKAGRQS